MNLKVEIKFRGDKSTTLKCSYCIPADKLISINMLEVFREAKKNKLPIEKVFSEIVSHEFLHALVYEVGGWDATVWIDTLTNEKLKSKGKAFSVKDWYGGIYGYKEVKEWYQKTILKANS